MYVKDVMVQNQVGLHARPATFFIQKANEAQTVTGGIPLTEVNLETMESLKCQNLYITGELLDIDGICGGYNLTVAWLTGLLAGKNIKDDKNA